MATTTARRTKAEDRAHAKAYKSPFGAWYMTAPEFMATPAVAEVAPLREVSAEIGAELRSLQAGVAPRKTLAPRAAAARDRAAAFVAANARPARPAQAMPVKTAPARRRTFAEVDALAATVPVGRYALPRKEASASGNTITFFEVTEYRGKRRIQQLVGGVGAFTRQNLVIDLQYFALLHIAADVAAAAKLYGDETTTCGFCAAQGRTSPLTKDRSRKAGYGKHCADKHGMPY